MNFNLFFIFLFLCSWTFAQTDTIASNAVQPPTIQDEIFDEDVEEYLTVILLRDSLALDEPIELASFEKGFQEKYSSSDFDYSLTKPRESLWSKLMRKMSEIFARFFRGSDVASMGNAVIWVMRLLAIGILGLVIYWLVNYINAHGGLGFFAKKDKTLNPEARTIEENIHEIDFLDLIQSYEVKNEFRYAVRYHYLHTLKLLNDKNLLEWDPEKTNLDYVNELGDNPLKNTFAQLTRIFDYVWYGEFMIDAESYDKIKAQFNALKQQV